MKYCSDLPDKSKHCPNQVKIIHHVQGKTMCFCICVFVFVCVCAFVHLGKNSLVMDTFATCFVIFRLNPERYKYKLFINKVTHMDLIITQSLCFILFLVLE